MLLLLWTWFLILWMSLPTWVPYHICQIKFQLVPRRLVSLVFNSLFACFPLAFELVKITRFIQVGLLLHLLAVIVYTSAPEVICFGKYQKNTMTFFSLFDFLHVQCLIWIGFIYWEQFSWLFFKNHNMFWRSLPNYLSALKQPFPMDWE